MARETVERLIDDIDGSEAHASIQFGLDGQSWSIDLNVQHEAELRATLGPFLEVARRVRRHPGTGRTLRAAADKGRNPAIRQWALGVGVELPTRGRIAGAVQVAFDAQDVAALYATVGLTRHQPGHREEPDHQQEPDHQSEVEPQFEQEQPAASGRRPIPALFSSTE